MSNLRVKVDDPAGRFLGVILLAESSDAVVLLVDFGSWIATSGFLVGRTKIEFGALGARTYSTIELEGDELGDNPFVVWDNWKHAAFVTYARRPDDVQARMVWPLEDGETK